MATAEQREALEAAAGSDAKRAYVRRIFSEIAPRYDLLNHLLSANLDRGWRRAAIDALQWRRDPEGTYLDLCAGTMDVGAELAARPGFRGNVLCGDFAEPMLRQGLAKATGLPVRPVVADALRLPLADGVGAGVIVAFGVRNFADLDAGLREVTRVLARGARLVILECSEPPNALVGALYHLYFRRILPVIGGLVSGHRTAYQYLPASVANFPRAEDLAARMRAAGLVNVGFRHSRTRHRRHPLGRAHEMSLDSLGEFIAALDAAGELVRVRQPVRARLELAEVADRAMKSPGGGPALLFEHVLLDDGTRSAYPVAINLFGSVRRMTMALGAGDLDEIGARITELLNLKVPEGLLGKLALLPKLLEVAKFPPRVHGGKAACQEVVSKGSDIDLSRLPVITCWPKDGGPYITLPMVISKDPKRGIRNVGMYRVQVMGKDSARDALAAPQSGRGALARDGGARRDDARVHRDRRRSGVGVLGVRAPAAHRGRVPLRGLPAEEAGGAGEGGDLRSRGAGGRGDRDRGGDRSAGAARDRRALRRPHRLLLTRRSLSLGEGHRGHHAEGPGLRDDDRRPAADGRLSISATPPSGSSCRCSS